MFRTSRRLNSWRRQKIITLMAGLSVLLVQGCADFPKIFMENLDDEGKRYVESLKDLGVLEKILLAKQIPKTYESFLANTETGTIGWGSKRSYKQVKPLKPGLNIIDSEDEFVAFVINHHNSEDKLQHPTHLAVRLILAMDDAAGETGKVSVYRAGRWWDDDSNKWVEGFITSTVPGMSPVDFAKAHNQTEDLPSREEIRHWHAKVLPSNPSTWEISSDRDFWSSWEELFPPSGDELEIKKQLKIEGDVKVFTKNILIRFTETPAYSSKSPVWFAVSREMVRGLRISTWCPDSQETYRRDRYVRFGGGKRTAS